MNQNKSITPSTPIFTIFTPTYNRAYVLGNAYTSLLNQTFSAFEWIIVDDGSTDNTKQIVENWQQQAKLTIHYWWQQNQGKHVAFNFAVSKAVGDLFIVLDSDDRCLPTALERLYCQWLAIPEAQRSHYSGVTCLCIDPQGHIIGDRFPYSPFDAAPLYVNYKLAISGDKWGFNRTEILKLNKFPVFAQERFCPEGLLWNRIAVDYSIRFINEALLMVVYQPDGLSARIGCLRYNNPMAMSLYYRELAELPVGWVARIKAVLNYGRTAPRAYGSLLCVLVISPLGMIGRLFTVVGMLIYLIDGIRSIKCSKQ